MKIFEVSTTAKPPEGRFSSWASVDAQLKDIRSGRLNDDFFRGQPYPGSWKPVELYLPKPLLPRPDFYNFGVGRPVLNKHAREAAGDVLESAGELLPVTIEGVSGSCYIFNCTTCIDVVDHAKSKWSTGPGAEFRILARPAFFGEKLAAASLFKIPEDGALVLYCIERTGVAGPTGFKALVQKHRLTGLAFSLVWSDKQQRPPKP